MNTRFTSNIAEFYQINKEGQMHNGRNNRILKAKQRKYHLEDNNDEGDRDLSWIFKFRGRF